MFFRHSGELVALSFLADNHSTFSMTHRLLWLRRAFGSATIVAVFLTAAFIAPRAATAQTIQVTPESVDFGVLKPGIATNLDVLVRNPGTGSIEVRLQLEDGPFAIDIDTLRLAAGGQRRVPVRFTAPDSGTYAGELNLLLSPWVLSDCVDASMKEPLELALQLTRAALRYSVQTGDFWPSAGYGLVTDDPKCR